MTHKKNSQFINEIINSKMIEVLRKKVPPHQLEEFDKYVEEKLAEYDGYWQKLQPKLPKGVKNEQSDKS